MSVAIAKKIFGNHDPNEILPGVFIGTKLYINFKDYVVISFAESKAKDKDYLVDQDSYPIPVKCERYGYTEYNAIAVDEYFKALY